MVWVISRYYNRDEAMGGLLERVAWEIGNKVSVTINLKTIFKRDAEPDGVKKLEEAKSVLECWREVYLYINS